MQTRQYVWLWYVFVNKKRIPKEKKNKHRPFVSNQHNKIYVFIFQLIVIFFFFSRNTPDITSRFGYCQHSFGSSWSDLLSLLESTFERRSVCYANNLIKFTNLEILITFLDSICLYLSKSLKISTTFICFNFLLG